MIGSSISFPRPGEGALARSGGSQALIRRGSLPDGLKPPPYEAPALRQIAEG
jgi:hypothetical protein